MAGAKQQELAIEEKLEQALVPEDEWPYEVPGNWVWTRLRYLIEVSKEKCEDFSDVEQKYVGLEHMQKDFGIIGHDSSKGIKSLKNVFYSGEILYGKLRPYLNKHDIASFDGVCSTDILVFRPAQITIAQFVNYFFDTDKFIEYAVSNSKGINLPRISESAILDAIISLPPLAEQQRIVDRIESLFAKLDQAKELAQNALDTFKTRKAAILHKAFTGEFTAKWREKNGVGMDSWSIKLLKDTDIEIIDGDRGTDYPKKEDFSSEGYCLFLNAKNVTKNGFIFEELQFISKTKDQILRKGRLERGDIVLTTRGTIGNIAYFDDNISYEHMRINSGMVIYRGGKEFYKPYLCYLYQSEYILNQISSIQTGSAQPQLPIKIMRELKLPIPSFSEQQEIIRILDSIFEKEQKAKELCDVINKIDLMKKAILARAFRGELGTNDPEEESAMNLLQETLNERRGRHEDRVSFY